MISDLIDYLMTENGPLPKLCPVQVNIFATGIEGYLGLVEFVQKYFCFGKLYCQNIGFLKQKNI